MHTHHKQYQQHRLDLVQLYGRIKPIIETKITEFCQIGQKATNLELFKELLFCLLTPQSKAETCLTVVNDILHDKLLLTGTQETLSEAIRCVRFRHTKAKNIVKARNEFLNQHRVNLKKRLLEYQNVFEKRSWLATEINGIGLKEASHFLRNIGQGQDIAILDRHILRSLVRLGVIAKIPTSLSTKLYLEIEKQMQGFSNEIQIPLNHLDLLLWFKETGKILK